MKKILLILLVLSITFCLFGCVGNSGNGDVDIPSNVSQSPEPQQETVTTPLPNETESPEPISYSGPVGTDIPLEINTDLEPPENWIPLEVVHYLLATHLQPETYSEYSGGTYYYSFDGLVDENYQTHDSFDDEEEVYYIIDFVEITDDAYAIRQEYAVNYRGEVYTFEYDRGFPEFMGVWGPGEEDYPEGYTPPDA
jgi:hypothetical protein